MNAWILRVITIIIPLITPELKKVMTEAIAQMKARAEKTDNPWDDVLVEIISNLLNPK